MVLDFQTGQKKTNKLVEPDPDAPWIQETSVYLIILQLSSQWSAALMCSLKAWK